MAWIYLDNEEISKQYQAGSTTTEIAKIHGVSNETIRCRLKQMGVSRRSLKGCQRS